MKTTHMKTIAGGLLTFTAACLAVPAFAQTSAREYSLEIERQPVADALIEFSRQTGLQFGYFPENPTEKILVGPLSGRYTADAAITQLLLPSGLSFERLNERTIAVMGPASTKSQRRGLLGTERKTDHRTAHSFMRLADLRLAEEPATEDVQQTGTAANARESESDNDKRKRQRGVLEEVIVTARKRTERLQDVPISIAVVSADDIDRRGLVGAADYLRGIPGVNQTDVGYGGQSIILRGLETTTFSQNFSGGTTAATYFGETPTTNSSGLLGSNVDIKLVDIERVEVLRGPQGTAFGNSSMGGAVRTIPAAPKLNRFEGRLGAGYSLTSGTGGTNYNLQAVGNLPLIDDRLAVRATAYAFSDSGIYHNRAGSDAAFQAVFAPFGVEAFASDDDEVGAYYSTGARVAALFKASDHLRFTLSYLTQKNETDGSPGANSGRYEQAFLRVAPGHVFRGQTGGIVDTSIDIANAVMEYDLSWADLLATYSYLEGGAENAVPVGNANLPWPISAKQFSPHRERSGEIRLATKFDGAWNFLAGLYAENQDDAYDSDWIWFGDPATNFFSLAGERDLLDYVDRRDLKQKAAFTEVSWEFLPRFTLTGGVRAYDYERTTRIDTSGPLVGGTVSSRRNDADANGENFRANLSYKPSDDTLLYAGWAQGFRLGRPQPEVPSGACDIDGDGLIDGTSVTIESTGHVDSDGVDNYELGGKFALRDRRLTIDAALFRMDWSDLPALVTPGCGFSYTANAGGARSEGIELQANFHVTDAFRVEVGGSWIDARLTKDVPVQGFKAGDRLPASPKVNANLGLQYEFDIAGHAAFVRADSIYVGPFFAVVGDSSPDTEAGDYVKLDATARVTMRNLNIDLYVRNLTNEDALTHLVSGLGNLFFGYRLRPRTIGIQLGYSFE